MTIAHGYFFLDAIAIRGVLYVLHKVCNAHADAIVQYSGCCHSLTAPRGGANRHGIMAASTALKRCLVKSLLDDGRGSNDL